MASLPFLHVIWAAFVRKRPFVFGLMLAFRLAILQALVLPKIFAFTLAKVILTFGVESEKGSRHWEQIHLLSALQRWCKGERRHPER